MFATTANPISKFQVAAVFVGADYPTTNQSSAACTGGLWEFPSEAELAEELFAALSAPLPVMSSPEIAPEDFERFAQGFLS
jgi:hypothetical protein